MLPKKLNAKKCICDNNFWGLSVLMTNSNLFPFLLYSLDFLLEGRATFPMVVLEDYLLPCDF
jgi:hypothetical protein